MNGSTNGPKNGSEHRNPMIGLGLGTAMAAVLLAGCSASSMPQAQVAASDAVHTMERGHTSEAIQHAELAVTAEPANAHYRMTLGNAYLQEGRFGSAVTTFQDAMTLGDNSPRAALSLALALTGEGRFPEAGALLRDWEGEIAAPDLGLAYALAGEPARGIHILSNAIRQGQNTVKVRQNLAYAYAVAGRWRDARLMVEQDVPADQVGARMQEWAQMTHPEAYQHRVAALLGVPAGVRDAGQPMHLALNSSPEMNQLAAEGGIVPAVSEPEQGGELAALDSVEEAPVSTRAEPEFGFDTYEPEQAPAVNFAEEFARPNSQAVSQSAFQPAPQVAALAPVTTDTMAFVSSPLVQDAPARQRSPRRVDTPVAPRTAAPSATTADAGPAARPSARTAPRSAAVASVASAGPVANATHLVQLGSFSSEQGARRAWGIYVSRHPDLANHEMVITEAVVRGKRYWRVSAGGFNVASSQSMCASVNSSSAGEGCISWAASTPLPGAVDRGGVMLARR